MKPADMPAGAVVVDTDVVSWLALREARAEEFAALLAGRELFISFATLAEVRTFLAMHVLEPDFHELLTKALDNYAVLPVNTEELVRRWVALRAATVNNVTADDRERRQNDTWIAASALSADPPLPLATGNLRDFRPLADASDLTLIHPDI
jgi:predicted nucleic acid-binding protein